MNPNCFRCGGSAFATLKIEAAIGPTRLEISADAAETSICAPCMIGLADWLRRGREVEQISSKATRRIFTGETAGAVG
jgi:hypothetical protein